MSTGILHDLKFEFSSYYEDKDTIGKRYRRMDAIGTPFCVTIDHQTLEDGTVTLRSRDTMLQERLPEERLRDVLSAQCSMLSLLKKIA